jgi:hypothetical protein
VSEGFAERNTGVSSSHLGGRIYFHVTFQIIEIFQEFLGRDLQAKLWLFDITSVLAGEGCSGTQRLIWGFGALE